MRALSPDRINTKSGGDYHHRPLPSPTTSTPASSASHSQHSQRRALPPQDEVIPGKQFHNNNNHNRHSNNSHPSPRQPQRTNEGGGSSRANSLELTFDSRRDRPADNTSIRGESSSYLCNGSGSNSQSSNVIVSDQRLSTEHWQPNNHQNYQAENESTANSRSTTNSHHPIQPDTITTDRGGASSHTSSDYTGGGSIGGPTLPKTVDTKHLGLNKEIQLSPVKSQSSSHIRHSPAMASDSRTRRRSPSPTLEERRQAQAISRTFLELRIAEAAMTQAQHQTQLGPQVRIRKISSSE